MSKLTVKKYLISLSNDDLLKVVMDLYEARKEAKDFLEYKASPDEKGKLSEYKEIITEEFYPYGRSDPKFRFSVCKKAISDFKKLKPSDKSVADLMLTFVECGCQFTSENGDMWEEYYDVMENNFRSTLKFIVDKNLFSKFKPRILQCLHWADDCGWGFPDTLWDYYYEITDEPVLN